MQKKKGKKTKQMLVLPLHIHTPLKTNIFPFFPQAYMNNFEKCEKKRQKKSWKGGGGAITAPCGQDTTPYGSKPLL